MSERACVPCGTVNEADARFCEGCGAPLERSCGSCGAPARATARFCRSCGAPLDGQPGAAPEAAVRKTVTVMFADLAGSTAFEEQVDAETARAVVGSYHDLLGSVAERHRAGVTKYIGDGFMAVWGVPEMGADDAERAVDTAVELQERFVGLANRVSEAHGVELALRVAVNTGEVVVGAGDADLVGDALNVGARLESECPRGHVVVGEETWRSTRGRHSYEPLGQVQVKGRASPVAVYQWLVRRSDTVDFGAFVGRDDEFSRLQTVFDDAVAARAARLVTVLGDPGVGKSRLAAEFTGAQRAARVIQTRCNADGTVALAPMVEVLRTRDLDADIPDGVPERDRILRDLRGMAAGQAGSVEETFWALRRFVEVLASDAPVVVVLDDIHWADTLLLDFVEHLAEWVREAPVLVLALARPEVRELRPDLVTVGGWTADAIHLGGLHPGATAELAASVLGSDQLPPELLSRLPSSTGGNPLFVRELVGMLVHDGVLVPQPGGWRLTIDADAIAVPPTIQALLASRLERLSPADRRVLELASVVGTDFSPGAVCALGDMGATEAMQALERLRRLELAQPGGTYIGDEPVWRFHHVLIRDVAYRRLLKSDRADLHERLADWVQAGGPSGAFDADEWVARHLESAHGYRCDLGVRDGHTAELALRSARGYLASAQRALDRDELVSAGTQAARGAALAAAEPGLHADLLLVGCEAFLSAGDVVAGAPLVDDLERVADDTLRPWATCYRCQFIVYTDPARLPDVDERLQDAIDEFARRKDAAGLAKAHRVRAGARARLGRVGDCEVDLFEALIAARQSGDHRQITAALGAAPSAALWGPSPAPKAGGRCLDVVRMQRMTTAAPSLEATSLRCLAVLELLRGRADKARTMLADARQVVADLGLRHGLMETDLFAGIIELMVGDPVAAEPHLRSALEGLDALGVGADAGQAAALLARSVLAQGRVDEADRYAAESERIAGHNLKTAVAWRAVRAEIMAAQGRYDGAVALAREAVAVAADTDLVLDHADACLALSRVLAAAGDARGAASSRADAESLYAAKDAVFPVGRATDTVAPAESAPPPPIAGRTRRLAKFNKCCEVFQAGVRAGRLNYSDRFDYQDRRGISGDPIVGGAEFHAAAVRKFEQFPHVATDVLAVRGENLLLIAFHWSDDDGNETSSLDLIETDPDGRVTYHGRFDEDDFWAAYRELERRYYAGEGAAFAEAGEAAAGWLEAISSGDLDAALRYSDRDFRWRAPPTALKATERTVDDMFAWMRERGRQVSSQRHWLPVLRWLSPTCAVGLGEIAGVGFDGERYEWNICYVAEHRDGRLATVREFDLDDEDAAFAYAESVVADRPSRLTVANRATATGLGIVEALRSHDIDTAIAAHSDTTVYDDRRRLWSGRPIDDRAGAREAFAHVCEQFSHFDGHILAVRGQRLYLGDYRWSDEAGNQSSGLHVVEIGDDGRIIYDGRFDEGDFEAAYQELERRYYAGEGAAFAESGSVRTRFVTAASRGDMDEAFSVFSGPDVSIENRSRSSVFPNRTAAELRSSTDELRSMVSAMRWWDSAVVWLSPDCGALLQQIEGTGPDGETYAWTRLLVVEFHESVVTSVCEFDPEDEESAFAYAESLVAPRPRRLAVANQASEVGYRVVAALRSGNVEAAIETFSDMAIFDDRRRLWSGRPIDDLAGAREAFAQVGEQFSHFELRILAVRGERLGLGHYRWSDDAGNQSSGLSLAEIGADGRTIYDGRFDEDDFEAAYHELERRYYAGEGAAFVESGSCRTHFIAAANRGDMDEAFSVFSGRDVSIENRAPSSVFGDRTSSELRSSMEELRSMVSSMRWWDSAAVWLSPNQAVLRQEVEASGPDGERYAWDGAYVVEFHDGAVTSVCRYDVEDEESAFAYAEERIPARRSRLAVTNRASVMTDRFAAAMQVANFDATIALYSNRLSYDDRRRLSGDPIADLAVWRVALERIRTQYNRLEMHTLAVRGERLNLSDFRWTDDDGNESDGLLLTEVDEDGLIIRHGNFDADDFDTAYRELESRYYAGEGAELAANGYVLSSFVEAMDALDVEAARRLCLLAFRWYTPASSMAPPERSLDEFFSWLQARVDQVSSVKNFGSVHRWPAPTCFVALGEVRATGRDGERYAWARIYVGEFSDGLLASMREFDDEGAAFTYAEGRIAARQSRLTPVNRARQMAGRFLAAIQAADFDAAIKMCSDQHVYDDHRRLSGDPIATLASLRAALERIGMQYNRLEAHTLAVRGDRLHLAEWCWSDDDGNQSNRLLLGEIDDDGLIIYSGNFDADDFDTAYRELESRYYAGEGADFAEPGLEIADFVTTKNRGDLDTLFSQLSTPDVHIESRSRSVFLDRSTPEYRASLEELQRLVGSVREWLTAIRWMSARWFVARLQREAVGRDGENYEWDRIVVCQTWNGRLASVCQFEPEDEEAAFAYAEQQVRKAASPLPLSNRASELAESFMRALDAGDPDWAMAHASDTVVLDDRRPLGGDPVDGKPAARAAIERILQQFNHFEGRTLAVRGASLALCRSRWSDDSGNESAYLHVIVIGDDGRIDRDVRFDGDDFGAAYRELEESYYAGDGARFAGPGMHVAEYVQAMNTGDFDRMFNELSVADLHVENRSRTGFPDRSADQLRASLEELRTMLSSVRSWFTNICWLSPTVFVGRMDREGIGHDGERYSWARILVNQYRGGRLAAICDFDAEDEEAAFAYAQELARETVDQSVMTNRARHVGESAQRAIRARNVEGVIVHWADRFVYDDRRRISGGPISSRIDVRDAWRRVFEQYNKFEHRVLAVRGETLILSWLRWSDESGNETSGYILAEIDADNRIVYEARFDEDDFAIAYHELERRYLTTEGAEFAANGWQQVRLVEAINELDVEAARSLCRPTFKWFSPPTTLAAQERSIDDLFEWQHARAQQVASLRTWNFAVKWLTSACCVTGAHVQGIGTDGEDFLWTRIAVSEFRDGLFDYVREFEDWDSASAYAEERVRLAPSRLPLINRATEQMSKVISAMRARDVITVADCCSDDYLSEDHRWLRRDPIRGKAALLAAIERILEQFNHFEYRILAVRGQRLTLGWGRWSDDAGNASTYLHVAELDGGGKLASEYRFDEDDFDSAYRKLEERYYDGAGAEFADLGRRGADFVSAMNEGDFDRVIGDGELSATDLKVENRSRSGLPDRSAARLRESLADLRGMLASTRTWFSAHRWLSPTLYVARMEREAVGHDGEMYSWTKITVNIYRDGRLALVCLFDGDDERAAFAYAEEYLRQT